MRCYDCGGGPSGSCKETVTTCGEGERCGFLERKPQPDLAQTKLSGNRESSVCPPSSQPLPASSSYYFSPSGFQNLPGSVELWTDGAAVRMKQPLLAPGTEPLEACCLCGLTSLLSTLQKETHRPVYSQMVEKALYLEGRDQNIQPNFYSQASTKVQGGICVCIV